VQLLAEDVRVVQAFADIATNAILQERLVKDRELLAAQLQTAPDRRVVIEQAKGVLAERLAFDMDSALSTLRDAAQRTAECPRSLETSSTTAGAPTSSPNRLPIPELRERARSSPRPQTSSIRPRPHFRSQDRLGGSGTRLRSW
jgi:hypothetical protein